MYKNKDEFLIFLVSRVNDFFNRNFRFSDIVEKFELYMDEEYKRFKDEFDRYGVDFSRIRGDFKMIVDKFQQKDDDYCLFAILVKKSNKDILGSGIDEEILKLWRRFMDNSDMHVTVSASCNEKDKMPDDMLCKKMIKLLESYDTNEYESKSNVKFLEESSGTSEFH